MHQLQNQRPPKARWRSIAALQRPLHRSLGRLFAREIAKVCLATVCARVHGKIQTQFCAQSANLLTAVMPPAPRTRHTPPIMAPRIASWRLALACALCARAPVERHPLQPRQKLKAGRYPGPHGGEDEADGKPAASSSRPRRRVNRRSPKPSARDAAASAATAPKAPANRSREGSIAAASGCGQRQRRC